MNLRPRRVEEPDINLVSLIDVVLMIVIFFMLSSTFNEEGRLKIRLPEAGAVAAVRGEAQPIVVSVGADGSYLVNGREVVGGGPEALRAALLAVAGEGSALAVLDTRTLLPRGRYSDPFQHTLYFL